MHRLRSAERGIPRARGLSLVELMVTVSVAAVLLALGAPSMVSGLRQQQLRSARGDLLAAFELAEVEALRRSGTVLLSRTTGCTTPLGGTTDWSCGFIVVVDANDNGVQDASETALKVFPMPGQVRLNHASGGADTVRMNAWGKVGTAQRFVLSAGSGSALTSSTVCLNTAGRAQWLAGNVACP